MVLCIVMNQSNCILILQMMLTYMDEENLYKTTM
jgi:hypothetical protein